MDILLAKAEEFNGYVKELVNWIRQEGENFKQTELLSECGAGVYDALNDAEKNPERSHEDFSAAIRLFDEFSWLMNLLVLYGILTEIQSKPLLSVCSDIKEMIEERESAPCPANRFI